MEAEPSIADGEATLAMPFARRMIELVERAGVPRLELMRAAGIDAAQLDAAEGRLPRSQFHRIFEAAIDLTGDPALGLHWLEGMTTSGFAPVSHLTAHAASLRHAFESLSAFERLLMDHSCFQLLEHDDEATVRCRSASADAPEHIRRFSSEMIVTAFSVMLRFFNARARFIRVCFEHAAPPYSREYTPVFDGAECFEQPFNGIVFERALLDLPSAHRDEDIHAALSEIAERRKARLTAPAQYAQRVRDFLVQQDSPRRISMNAVARSLGLSVRSLRRRLNSEGKSYNAIENDARGIVAKHLLRDEGRTIQQTAHEMGFADTTAFHRAFKRWTGTTPTAYRASS